MMGASPTDETRSVPAAVMSTQAPEVSVDETADSDASVFVEGTMYHDGLNANAWGLTEAGAHAIAEDLVGCDFTAGHPDVRGTKYDRSIAEGKGAPIGTVRETEVVEIEGAAVDGGGYTAQYTAEVLDPTFAQRYQTGLLTADGYGTSIGIYADPESASCSVCNEAMNGEECDHSRGETVEADDGEEKVAGPLYDDGASDHLAAVWRPAYDGADAEVAAQQDGAIAQYSEQSEVLTASTVLGSPYDAQPADTEAAGTAETTAPADESPPEHEYAVRVDDTMRRTGRGSFPVKYD